MIKTWGFLFFVMCMMFGYGQSPGTITKTFDVRTAPVFLDSLTILPGSVRCVKDKDTLKNDQFTVDYIRHTITFNPEISGKLQIQYYRLNINISPSNQLYDSIVMQPSARPALFSIENQFETINDLFGGNEINKRGSISRGVTFGNRQNLGINSTLNLELTGKLSENLNILASVSDANIPIQPDGNTNKLQEFDQVFIQLYNAHFKLIAGDFWINKPQGYFLNYKKRGQGLTYTHSTMHSKHGNLTLQSSMGLSKGKFQRQIIQGIENNQGPYRLTGAENEPFIVVLSGTERVYIDGRLLERGQEFDYTIDYNSAELVFTSRNLITKDVRIVVEFQYSDQSYTRALVQQHVGFSKKNTTLWLNYYQEQDLKNQPLQLSLTQGTKNLIGNVGDSLSDAFLSTIDSVGFQPNQNQYYMTDSLGFDSVLVFSIHPDSAKFRASFIKVGSNKGDYVLFKTTAFGNVFKWVAPIGNVPQGSYMPIQRINAPKRKRMLVFGVEQTLGEKWQLITEFSATENAINLYSVKDRQNDWGWGNKTKLSRTGTEKPSGWKSLTSIESEFIGPTFTSIEPYRAVEFDRDWNVRGLKLNGTQLNVIIGNKFQHSRFGKASFQAQHYGIGNQFMGYRIFSDGALKKQRFSATWDASGLTSSGVINSSFIRHRADISMAFKNLRIGIKDDQELNKRDQFIGLSSMNYAFYDVQGYIQNADSGKTLIKLFYRERLDWRSDSSKFNIAARGTTLGGEFQRKGNNGNALGAVLGLRSLVSLDSTLISIQPDQSLVGRINATQKGLKGALSFDAYYELSSGLEQKRNFIYLEVNSGQGIYTWIDYNQDGVKDLNEFETAAFIDQANYIRVFTPSNAYQKTYSNEFNQSLFWKPEAIWGKKHGALKWLSVASDQLRIRSSRKFSAWNTQELLNPLSTNILNPSLISSTFTLRNSLFLFRTSSKVNGHYVINRGVIKTLLATGYDAKDNLYHELMFRWNVLPSFSLKAEAQRGYKTSSVDYTVGRNYLINLDFISFEMGYQPSTNYRFTMSGKVSSKQNKPIFGGELANSKEFGVGFKYNTTQKGSIQGDIKYLNFIFVGNANTAVAFEMLEALRPGSNYTWNITWQRNVGKNLQLNLIYSGRKTGTNPMVHNGGMELRAFF